MSQSPVLILLFLNLAFNSLDQETFVRKLTCENCHFSPNICPPSSQLRSQQERDTCIRKERDAQICSHYTFRFCQIQGHWKAACMLLCPCPSRGERQGHVGWLSLCYRKAVPLYCLGKADLLQGLCAEGAAACSPTWLKERQDLSSNLRGKEGGGIWG